MPAVDGRGEDRGRTDARGRAPGDWSFSVDAGWCSKCPTNIWTEWAVCRRRCRLCVVGDIGVGRA